MELEELEHLELLELLAVDDDVGAGSLGSPSSSVVDLLAELPDLDAFGSLEDEDLAAHYGDASVESVAEEPKSPSAPGARVLQTCRAASGGRKRVKDELEYLRQHVASLAQRLERLRRDEHAITEQPTLWEDVARRQLDAKRTALVENAKLRTLVQSQLRVAQSLSRALRRRPDVSWLDPLGSSRAKRPRRDSAESVFAMLSARVDALFAQVDAVMRGAGLVDARAGLQDGVVKIDAAGALFLEAVYCAALPFGVHVTGAALWEQMSAPSMTVSNGVYHALDATEDELRAQFSVTMRLGRAEAVIHERLVGRRVVEPTRVVLVWCTVGDPEGSLLGDGCLRIRSSGWTVVEALPPPESGALLKSVVHMTPEVVSGDAESSYRAGVFTDVVLSGFHQNVSMVHQYIENSLLRRLSEPA